MRNLILGISIVCLALSGLITFKALNLPEKKPHNSASQPPIKIHESSQAAEDTVLQPAGKQDPGSNVNQTLQNTISHLEQKLENNITDSQMNIQALENTVKQLEQKLADKIAGSQTDSQAPEKTTAQLEQKLADEIAASQEDIQTLENTVKQLEQKLADKIADSQTGSQATEKTTAQLEQKLADKIADSQMNIEALENTVKQLEQKLADKTAYSQTDTQSAKNTTAQLEQKLADKIADSQMNIQALENTVKQLEQKLLTKDTASRTDVQPAESTPAQLDHTPAFHKNTAHGILEIDKPENTEQPAGRLLFEVIFSPGKFAIDDEIKKIIQQSTQEILSLPPNYRVVVEGHTDNIPIKITSGKKSLITDNMSLSIFRANQIAGIFEQEGLSSQRISAIGYGATRPVASNNTAEGREKNRRVVVRLIPEEKGI